MSHLLKVFVFALIMFCIVFAAVIGARLDESVITLIGGFVLGSLIAAPLTAILITLMLRRREATAVPNYPPPQQHQPAPQFLVLPPMYGPPNQQIPQAAPRRELPEPYSLPTKRRFYLIGEDGQPTEIQPEVNPSFQHIDDR